MVFTIGGDISSDESCVDTSRKRRFLERGNNTLYPLRHPSIGKKYQADIPFLRSLPSIIKNDEVDLPVEVTYWIEDETDGDTARKDDKENPEVTIEEYEQAIMDATPVNRQVDILSDQSFAQTDK